MRAVRIKKEDGHASFERTHKKIGQNPTSPIGYLYAPDEKRAPIFYSKNECRASRRLRLLDLYCRYQQRRGDGESAPKRWGGEINSQRGSREEDADASGGKRDCGKQ